MKLSVCHSVITHCSKDIVINLLRASMYEIFSENIYIFCTIITSNGHYILFLKSPSGQWCFVLFDSVVANRIMQEEAESVGEEGRLP